MVVVGDPGVGKTSLILAVAAQDFPEHPVPTLPPTSLPAEFSPDGRPRIFMQLPHTAPSPSSRIQWASQGSRVLSWTPHLAPRTDWCWRLSAQRCSARQK